MFPPSTAPSAPAPSTPESARPRPRLPSFSDGIGDRVLVFDQKTNAWMELLRFKREFSHARGFFNALKDRIQELQTLNHDGLSKARSIEWLAGGEGLALVSNHTPGKRLSELTTEARGPQFAQELIGQISPALAALHVHSFNSFHGAITADRIVVTPEGRLVLTESAIGAGLNALQLPAVRLQSDLFVAVPAGPEPVTLNARGDLIQLGLVALSLLLGRKLDAADYPVKTKALLDELAASDAATTPEFRAVHEWLGRALQVGTNPFNNGLEADEAFKRALESAAAAAVVVVPAPVEAPKTEPAPLIIEPAPVESPIARADHQHLSDDNDRVNAKRVVSMPLPVASSVPVESPVEPVRAKSLFDDDAAVTPAASTPSPLFLEPLTAEQRTKKRSWLTIGFGTLAAAEAAVIVAMFYMMPAFGSSSLTLSTPPAIPSALALAAVPTMTQTSAPLTPAPAPTAEPASTPTSTPAEATAAAAAAPTAAPVTGRVGGVKIAAPFEMQVFENGNLLGSTSGTIALNEGTHALDLVSESLAFRYRQTVQVKAGQLSPVTITAPNGRININAAPWATVTIDGNAAGDTPLANLSIPIGTHEIVFTHPQFGTQKQTVVVKADAPARVSATMQRSGGGQ